ncbi:radical SAM protein [Desulfobulbus propionicus]
MNTNKSAELIQADYINYKVNITAQRNRYLQYPRCISIETQVKCNSQCIFCPYSTSPRQGQIMSTELFYKLLDDLSQIPSSHAFSLTLHRLNEPLLDPRLPEFHQKVAQKFPQAQQSFWSNGTTIKPGKFEWMADFKNASLTVSLNSINNEEHVKLMGFGVDLVIKNLDYVHALKASGKFPLTVMLCAPYQDQNTAAEFCSFCQHRWPHFKAASRPLFVWTGGSTSGKKLRDLKGLPSRESYIEISSLPCGQWFDLHVLANGFITKCCIDETGYNTEKFNAEHQNILSIYQNRQKLRTELPSRSSINECKGCLHLG